MDDTKWVRLTAVAGLAFAVLIIVAAGVQGSRPSLSDSSQEIFTYIKDHQDALKASAALFGLAMAAVLFWAWGLLSALRKAENGNSDLGVVAVAGGVLASAMTIASSAVIATTALRIDDLGPTGGKTFFTLYQLTLVGTNFGLAVLIGAAAAVSLRRGLFTRRFTIVSIILALVTLVGGLGIAYARDAIQIVSGVALVLDVVWILVVSIRLWRTPEIAVS